MFELQIIDPKKLAPTNSSTSTFVDTLQIDLFNLRNEEENEVYSIKSSGLKTILENGNIQLLLNTNTKMSWWCA